MTDAELGEMTDALFSEAFTEYKKERNALSSGPPEMYFRLKGLLDKTEYQPIKIRLETIANSLDCEIDHVFLFFYCLHEEALNQAKASGGADPHGDKFPRQKSNARVLDTLGTPAEGEKTMTFVEVKTGKMVTITVPHGTVIVMSSRGAGNHFEEFQHAVEGAWGTSFFSMDVSFRGVPP